MALAGGTSGIAGLIERQMRNWELAREQRRKVSKEAPAPAEQVKFYVAISRECGCGEEQIVETLARLTGFQKYDKEILDYMVSRKDVRHKLYGTLDDQTVGWIEDICSSLVLGPAVGEVEYFNRLCRAVLAVCHNVHAIIIGRGANFILPRDSGLAVRLVAPNNYRLEKYAKQTKLDLKAASEQMERIDRGRGRFIEGHFGKYAYDPRRYDLVINVCQFSENAVAETIVQAMQAKAGETLKLPLASHTE